MPYLSGGVRWHDFLLFANEDVFGKIVPNQPVSYLLDVLVFVLYHSSKGVIPLPSLFQSGKAMTAEAYWFSLAQ